MLKTKVRELTGQVQVLTLENQTLKAEVDLYRSEAALPNLSQLALGKQTQPPSSVSLSLSTPIVEQHFVRSGIGIYPQQHHVSLPNLHSASNVLSCALSPDDVVVATGGADSYLSLCPWGGAYFDTTTDHNNRCDHDDEAAATATVRTACRIGCSAPVIATAFSRTLPRVVACATMDGTVTVVQYATASATAKASTGQALVVEASTLVCRHSKYVKCLAWSSRNGILASASADGAVYLHRIERTFTTSIDKDQGDDDQQDPASALRVTQLESLHLPGAVEALCWVGDELFCYARNTPHLTCFDLGTDTRKPPRLLHLNASPTDSHVSFAIMDLHCDNGGKYLVAATDANRNLVVDVPSGSIVRNLYGHANDSYSHPKVAWNCGGQYVLGNTQDDNVVVVWDVASSQIVDRLRGNGAHGAPIRDLRASRISETLVTTSFDKRTNLWFYDSDNGPDVVADMSM